MHGLCIWIANKITICLDYSFQQTNELNKKNKKKLIVFTILNMLYDKYAAHSVC